MTHTLTHHILSFCTLSATLHRLLNEKKNRFIFLSGTLLSWSLPQLSITGDNVDQATNCGGVGVANVGEVDSYCQVWLAGYILTTLALLLVLLCAYWQKCPRWLKQATAAVLSLGAFLVMIGTFVSLNVVCAFSGNSQQCNAGFVAPPLLASLVSWALAVDLVTERLGNARHRVCVLAGIHFLQSLLALVWIFHFSFNFSLQSINNTVQGMFRNVCTCILL